MKIYVASSWRNRFQPAIVGALRAAGHRPYDFRSPCKGNEGFAWSDISPLWLDFTAMVQADVGVLVLPRGKPAHLEAGYFVGAGKRLYILALEGRTEPEPMYAMGTIVTSIGELIEELAAL